MDGEAVKIVSSKKVVPVRGSAGLCTQLPGGCTTVSQLAQATGNSILSRDTK